ncbi:hypothetical protein ACIBCA_05165 [Kitasatospora sp. NPDC051170]|uniref:hypothetical protein n=1 Tax=Kitasatospora sp. NPDC051170 TaxID=3364056 RepID=UPI0037A3DF39
MSAERPDGFEEQLAVRLGARAASVGGSPPLAALREAGRRRARRQNVVRGVASVALLAAGVGVLGQIGGRGGEPPPTATPTATAPWWSAGPVNGCQGGPSSMRTPGWYPPTDPRTVPSDAPLLGQERMPGMAPQRLMTVSPTGKWLPFDEAVSRAGAAVAELGVGPYRDQFFGMCVGGDARPGTLYVMRTPGAADFERAVRERVGSSEVGIEFRDAAASRVALDALAARIAGEAETYWKPRNVTLVGVAVCADGAGVRVDVAQQAEAVRAEILARYGPLVVEVVHRGG